MSIHIEGMGAAYASAEIVPGGEEIVEDYEESTVNEGNVALVLSADDVMVLEGTPAEVGALIKRINEAWAEYLRDLPTGDDVLDRAFAAIQEVAAKYREPLGPPNPAHGELPEHALRELEPDVEDASVCCPDCGDTLGVMVREVDHRRGAYWTGDGEIVVGKSNDVQTEEIELYCHQGHGHFVVPDVADYS